MTVKQDTGKRTSSLHTTLLQEAKHTYFTDGCCYRPVRGENIASYAVVELINNNYVTVETGIIPQPASAQLAEIVALTRALELLEGKTGNIITDSAYAHAAVHIDGPMWVKINYQTSTGTTVKHCEALKRLVKAMHLPIKVAVVKCKGYHKKEGWISQGNNEADIAAKTQC